MGNTKIPKTPDADHVKRLRFSPSDYPCFFLRLLRLSWKSASEEQDRNYLRSLPPAARHLNGRDERNCHFFSCGEKEWQTKRALSLPSAPNGDLWHDQLIVEEERNIVHPPGGAPGQRKKEEERLNFVPSSFPCYLHHGRKSLLFCFPPSLKGNPNHPMNERTTALVTSRVTLL